MRVLVTGSSGQLGKTIEELYLNNDEGIEFVFTSKSRLDITDINSIQNIFETEQFDYCINCAAYTDVEQAEKTPKIAFRVNAEAVKNLAKACKKSNTVLIHISTDYVFDGEKEGGYTPEDLPNPINEYGKSKLLGEQYIQEVLERYFIIRTSWLYSKKYGNNFYKTILKKAKTETKLSIIDSQKGCPTDTENLARYVIELIKNNTQNYSVYHFSDKVIMTWYGFTLLILKENNMLNKIELVKVNNYVTFAKRPKNSVLLKKI
ncbi:dTDP-4-dehydrorhamnose reductase [Algibacter lectus]|uniref:dTDP-4-dehydrorhamnose reductase n=1 Tax=Algibacter lectus TaxID=221126 RepID=UPI0026E93DE3|nr:dTDP-4-dehydrorhamnose reductase [Algibacter lectus]MDO7137101.1 dTDP-4-dehydrorhamnose reductase [Algibacter lectus]